MLNKPPLSRYLQYNFEKQCYQDQDGAFYQKVEQQDTTLSEQPGEPGTENCTGAQEMGAVRTETRQPVESSEVERVARAIARSIYQTEGLETMHYAGEDDYANKEWEHYELQAEAAIAALPMRESSKVYSVDSQILRLIPMGINEVVQVYNNTGKTIKFTITTDIEGQS